jgi:hypothetical protein
MQKKLIVYLEDFRFWILIFLLIRLIGITNPPLEISHNWRQVTVNMIARNYFEGNTTFFYPMMDNAGEKSGITGTEFPLLNELISATSIIFGWQHWYGRLINLLVTSLGIWFFYRWIRDFIDQKAAFPAGLILLVSMWFSFARKSMPDTFSMAICFVGLYYGYSYLRNGGFNRLIAFFIFGLLGVLCKLPALVALSPLAIEIIFNYSKIKERIVPFVLSGVLLASVAAFWYFYWFQHLVAIGNWQFYMFGPGFPVGLFDLFVDPYETLDNFFFESIKFTGFIAFLLGLYIAIREKNRYVFFIFCLYSFAFLLFMIQAGSGFTTHDYYTIPYVPMLAFFAGWAISRINSINWRIACLVIICCEGIANQHHDFWIHSNQEYKADIELLCDSFSEKNDLIIINAGQNPQEIYFAHRKGWTIDHPLAINNNYVDSLSLLGAKYLIIDKHIGENIPEGRILIKENNDFAVYKLH